MSKDNLITELLNVHGFYPSLSLYLTFSDPAGKIWCSTKVDEHGRHTNGQNEWGYCDPKCKSQDDLKTTTSTTDAPDLAHLVSTQLPEGNGCGFGTDSGTRTMLLTVSVQSPENRQKCLRLNTLEMSNVIPFDASNGITLLMMVFFEN